MQISKLTATLFVFAQRILPRSLMTAITYRVARIRIKSIKDFLIRNFVRAYGVNVDEVRLRIPDQFECFNDFFIRELTPDARPIDDTVDCAVSPVDGTISAIGEIENYQLFQAKGIQYSIKDLLATDTDDAEVYNDGQFATIYLAPYNYHRVHAPLDGVVTAIRYMPGDLYSVNDRTVARLPGLFVRNERLVCHFRTTFGVMVLIFVGALNVGSISTRWTGQIKPRKTGVVHQFNLQRTNSDLSIKKGELLGWFNMGSTVILLHPPESGIRFANHQAGTQIRVGEILGKRIGEL